MAEEIDRYRGKVSFLHKFQNVSQQFENCPEISSPKFFARNIPFWLDLVRGDNGELFCDLVCKEVKKGFSLNVQFRLSLISPSKTRLSEGFSCTLKPGGDNWYTTKVLSELFPGAEILVDDAITLEVCLLVEEPHGIREYKPPKEKLRQELQISGNLAHANGFERLLDSGDFSDVTFFTSMDSIKIKAHKNILAAQSHVFATMLTSDMREAKDNEIVIDDMGATSLQIMLRHIYTGQLGFPKGLMVDLNICQELANAGEKYDLQNLKEYAAMAMTEFVSLENAMELFVFAKRLKAEAATKALTSYYAENVLKILEKI